MCAERTLELLRMGAKSSHLQPSTEMECDSNGHQQQQQHHHHSPHSPHSPPKLTSRRQHRTHPTLLNFLTPSQRQQQQHEQHHQHHHHHHQQQEQPLAAPRPIPRQTNLLHLFNPAMRQGQAAACDSGVSSQACSHDTRTPAQGIGTSSTSSSDGGGVVQCRVCSAVGDVVLASTCCFCEGAACPTCVHACGGCGNAFCGLCCVPK